MIPQQNGYTNIERDKKIALQIKNLISIRKNKFSITIAKNTFSKNSVIKGLIYIENLKEFQAADQLVLIYDNTFEKTATFFDTSAIFIRHEADNRNLKQYTVNGDTIPCFGNAVYGNKFEDNFGCPLYGGSLIQV